MTIQNGNMRKRSPSKTREYEKCNISHPFLPKGENGGEREEVESRNFPLFKRSQSSEKREEGEKKKRDTGRSSDSASQNPDLRLIQEVWEVKCQIHG